jgi:hypothetical protein
VADKECRSCGEPYAQRVEHGRVIGVNLDPVSGLCIPCLCASAKVKAMPGDPGPVDVKQRQFIDD